MCAQASSLTTPVPFLPRPGELSMKWEDWKEYFLNYLEALEDESGATFPSKRKRRLLLHNLGPEGIRVFRNLVPKTQPADDDVFQNAIDDLDNHY